MNFYQFLNLPRRAHKAGAHSGGDGDGNRSRRRSGDDGGATSCCVVYRMFTRSSMLNVYFVFFFLCSFRGTKTRKGKRKLREKKKHIIPGTTCIQSTSKEGVEEDLARR